MESNEEKINILACPAARRAIRQQNKRVMWCLTHIALFFDKEVKYSDKRNPGFLSPGTTFNKDALDFPVSHFTVTTNRSRLHNNEVVMLISQVHSPTKAEFELLLKRCKPVSLV